jgi:hypothetical protein
MNPVGRARFNIVPIANGYRGASQPFLFARVTREVLASPTLVFGGGDRRDVPSAHSCCTRTTLSTFRLGSRPPPEFSPRRRGHSPCLWVRHCMGETLLLLSCGAAFITGLMFAAASLFG